MSLFRELTEVQLHIRKDQDRQPILGLMNKLYTEAGSMDHARANTLGHQLVTVTEAKGPIEATDRLVLAASVTCTPDVILREAIARSIHLSSLLQSAPVTLSFCNHSLTVTDTDKPSTVVHEFIRETALARGPSLLGPKDWGM